MGRTGHLFAYDAEAIVPDILCIAKGLGSGYQPIGAMLCTKNIYETISEGSGFFQHGHTYLGHPVAAAAGLAVVQEIIAQDLVQKVQDKSKYLEYQLRYRFEQNPHVGDIRGRGFFWGLEFVRDRQKRLPFESDIGLAAKLKKAAFDEGLICYPMPGTRDGKNGDHVLLAPPFIAKEEEINQALDGLSRAIEKVVYETNLT